MSDEQLNWPVNAPPETETLRDTNILGSYATESTLPGKKQRGTTFQQFREWLSSKIASGDMLLNPRSFTAGRFDSKELTSGSLSVSGWYTIAEAPTPALNAVMAEISVYGLHGALKCSASYEGTSTVKTQENCPIKILNFSTFPADTSRPQSFRWAKSDSVSGAGAKLQVYLECASSYPITTLLQNNGAQGTRTGFILVDPYLDEAPVELPDGVTVATFLVAGEELSFNNSGTLFFSDWVARRGTDDAIICAVVWPEIPKKGTNLVITLPSTSLSAIDGDGVTGVISGVHTVSNLTIDGAHITFQINETGVFAGMNAGMLGIQISGTGCKLTIT